MKEDTLPLLLMRIQSLSLVSLLCVFSNCAHIVRTERGFKPGTEPEVNGATISPELIPKNEEAVFAVSAMVYLAAGERAAGPYECLFTAWGNPGLHRYMILHSLTVRTENGKVTDFSPRRPARVDFAPAESGERTQATHIVDQLIDLDSRKIHAATMRADITIATTRHTRRRTVEIPLQSTKTKNVSFRSIISDIQRDRAAERDAPWE